MKKSNLYTRTGDDGTTSLVGGRRILKSSARLEAYGTLDELNSLIGLLNSYVTDEATQEFLYRVQCDLFSLGSQLATHPDDARRECAVTEAVVEELERAIDETDTDDGKWRGFIVPSGSQGATLAHVCRTVCRRLERRMYAIAPEGGISPVLFQYVNRLSDYFFALAKKINYSQGVEEKFWKKR